MERTLPSRRVALMVTWHSAVAETIWTSHMIFSSFMPSWNSTIPRLDGIMGQDETRRYHYDFETYSIVTWALNGIVLLAFMNCR